MKAQSVEGSLEARLSGSPGSKARGAAGVSEAVLEKLPIKELTGVGLHGGASGRPPLPERGTRRLVPNPSTWGPDAAYANTSRPLPLVLRPKDFARAGNPTGLTGV